MEWPWDSNRDLHTVTWLIHRQNYQWVYRQDVSVDDSIGKIQYIHTLPPLSSSISPSSSSSQLSPPKLQTTTHPPKNILLFSAQALIFLILLYGHNIRSLIYCGLILLFFIVFLVYVFC